jgi:acetyl-CoA carboxylase biotin carboxylase subunit
MKKVLIANRGEIAVRVIQTLKRMGIASVAIYSEADRESPHVVEADEAVCVGPPASSESYLRGDHIISIAQAHNCDAIHPGYGFLSENPEFSAAVMDSGIIFIGPGPDSMRTMGSKLAAKEAVSKYNIPMVPGTPGAISDIKEAREIAIKIGLPVLIKASAGGGGKGMRLVEDINNIEEQIQSAMSEATSAFGDGSVFVEKYVTSPRHIEFQIFADQHGNCVHLFERECSIQRRHQKVIEEAPSVVLDSALRERMGQAAIQVAKSCNYVGAGTVEFLLDSEMNFYFLEMNTRLQVEHPVTEMITGLDLVEWQIRVARGEKLPLQQDEIKRRGHSIQLRVYAEDTANNFAPSIGKLERYRAPEMKGVRVDDGFREGMDVPIYYDPMISKLIVFANNRPAAISLMTKAIEAYEIKGIDTTLPFGLFAMDHAAFTSGHFDTHFVGKYFLNDQSLDEAEYRALSMAALHFYLKERNKLKPVKHV